MQPPIHDWRYKSYRDWRYKSYGDGPACTWTYIGVRLYGRLSDDQFYMATMLVRWGDSLGSSDRMTASRPWRDALALGLCLGSVLLRGRGGPPQRRARFKGREVMLEEAHCEWVSNIQQCWKRGEGWQRMASGHKVIKQAHRAKAGGVCVGGVGGGVTDVQSSQRAKHAFKL